uniref:Uncharacterized protein n=1 Tax=Aegilops tauschii subsp. strangulata TaxID=200361 RepID=A0A453PN64_AEGTS
NVSPHDISLSVKVVSTVGSEFITMYFFTAIS